MMNFLIILAVLATVGYIAFLFVKNNKNNKSNKKEQNLEQNNRTDDVIDQSKNHLVHVKRTNLIEVTKQIALSPSLDHDVKNMCFGLIDDIWQILEDLNEKYPSQDVTFRINRMSSGHLSELIQTFNALESPSEDDINIFVKQIENMQKGVDLAKDALAADDQARFDSTAAFLEGMHGKTV